MGAFDEPIRELAESIIDLFVDETVVLTRYPTPDYTASTSTPILGTAQTQSVKISPPMSNVVRYRGSDTTKEHSFVCFMAAQASAWQVQPDDTFVFEGKKYVVGSVTLYSSGDEYALYEIGVDL